MSRDVDFIYTQSLTGIAIQWLTATAHDPRLSRRKKGAGAKLCDCRKDAVGLRRAANEKDSSLRIGCSCYAKGQRRTWGRFFDTSVVFDRKPVRRCGIGLRFPKAKTADFNKVL